MNKFTMLQEIRDVYSRGENIMRYLNADSYNSKESILISYDFQAGSYIDNYHKNLDSVNLYTDQLANCISGLGRFDSILEAGVGEATTFRQVLKKCDMLGVCGRAM